jgi:hypothetical protein
VRCVFGEETNFGLPDVKAATYLVNKYVFLYNFSDLGVTNFARAPYSADFGVGANRPRKVVETEAMDEMADWPTRLEDFRFDPIDPSDVTWHRWALGMTACGTLGMACGTCGPNMRVCDR